MKQDILRAYLDDYDLITLLVDSRFYKNPNQVSLYHNKTHIGFSVLSVEKTPEISKLVLKTKKHIFLRDDWSITLDESVETEIYSGKVVRTDQFIQRYNYKKDDLGLTYTPSQSIFKVWAPIAKKVNLCIKTKDDRISEYPLKYDRQGVWTLEIDDNLEDFSYNYSVYVNGSWKKIKDPYAFASRANGHEQVILDLNKTYKMKHSYKNATSPIIYEVSVRDFSSDKSTDFKNAGKYLAMIERGLETKDKHPIGLDYIKEMGFSHIQVLPVFDFTGINELKAEDSYNWGYNPSQYFVPEGSYSSNANDPYRRINELKEIIDIYHQNNLGVIMDVVYNHVNDHKLFPYEILVPGYSFRIDDFAMMTDFSGCKNDLNTSRPMIQRLIIDSLSHWVKNYKIDGFRFDLMGLIDYNTMNEVNKHLMRIKPDILIYGEGWKIDDNKSLAHMFNSKVSHHIGFFSDQFRDSVKGSTFNPKDLGYSLGNESYIETVKDLFLGKGILQASQSINYVECHDNQTFFDKAMLILKDQELVKKHQLVATCMTLLVPGIPFIHQGQEFYRSKDGAHNSYNLGDEINKVSWNQMDENWKDIVFIQSIIKFRRSFKNYKIKNVIEIDNGLQIQVDHYSIYLIINNKRNIINNHLKLVNASRPLKSMNDQTAINDVGVYIFERIK